MANGEANDRTTKIIVAVIGAIAVIVAAIIGTMKGCHVPDGEKPLTLKSDNLFRQFCDRECQNERRCGLLSCNRSLIGERP